jgi:RNA-directed DNA polymerase
VAYHEATQELTTNLFTLEGLVNAGKNTPGVDKVLVKTPAARGGLVDHLSTFQPWRAKPVRRVYIPKKSDSSKRRPLGIPTVMDRCLQAMVKNALEPAWESRFDGSSYGFRQGETLTMPLRKSTVSPVRTGERTE